MQHLEGLARDFIEASIAPSMARVYATGQRRYLSFCRKSNSNPLPLSENQMCPFVVHRIVLELLFPNPIQKLDLPQFVLEQIKKQSTIRIGTCPPNRREDPKAENWIYNSIQNLVFKSKKSMSQIKNKERPLSKVKCSITTC